MLYKGVEIPDWVLDEMAQNQKRKLTNQITLDYSCGGVRSLKNTETKFPPKETVKSYS